MAIPGVANWQAQILQGVGAPVNPSNLSFLNAWQRAEGGTAANNPFNTTQTYQGATPYNTLSGGGHVYNYPSPQAGLQATLETLRNGRYGPILSALKQGDPVAAANALGQSPWGTNASLVLKILGQNQTKVTPTPRTLQSATKTAPAASVPATSVAPAALPAQQQTNNLAPLLSALMSSTSQQPAPTPQLQVPTQTAPTYAMDPNANPWAASFPIPAQAPQLQGPTLQPQANTGDDALFASILSALGQKPPAQPLGGGETGTTTVTTPAQTATPAKTAMAAPSTGPTKIGDPVPTRDLSSIGGEHPTEGLPGYPAHDYFAKAGSPAVAPVSGRVIRLSGHDPSMGPAEGPHGPFGWSVYIQGADGHTYYLTHMGSRDVKVGETVRAGQAIGTVGNYAQYGTPSHIHMGVN